MDIDSKYLKESIIVFITSDPNSGGAGKMMKYVANTCSKAFKQVYILSLFGETPKGVDDKINSIDLNIDCSTAPLKWRPLAIRALRKRISTIKPTIVCPFTSDIASLTRIATLGLPYIVCSAERGDPYRLSFIWKCVTKWTYRHCDYCFFQLDKAREFFGTKVARKSFVIPNPYLPKTNNEPFHGERKKTIVSVGRFVEQKGYDVLINAFGLVYKDHPEYKLVIYGDGPLRQEYETLVNALGLTNVVEMPGLIDNAPETIKGDGIFVLSSVFEGIPNTMIEAMSVGLPVVATDCTPGGPAFLSNYGENATLVPVGDYKKMAKAIINLIETPQLRQKYEIEGRNFALSLNKKRIDQMWLSSFEYIVKRSN